MPLIYFLRNALLIVLYDLWSTTVEVPVSGHPREVKKCPQLELAAYGNVYIQLEFKRGFCQGGRK